MIKRMMVVGALGLVVASGVQAESRISAGGSTGQSVTADLKVRVVVPKIVYLRIGSSGAAKAEVTFALGGATTLINAEAGSAPNFSTLTPATITGANTGATGADVSVHVMSNVGTITMSCNQETPSTFISGSDFTVTSSNTNLVQPGGNLACASGNSSIVGGTVANITNETATWTVAYSSTAIPAAGSHEINVRYTASQP